MKEILKNISIFSEFNTHEISVIEKICSLKKFNKDDMMEENEKELKIISKGRIIGELNLPESIEKKYTEYLPGDFFGQLSLFGYKSRFDTYYAAENSELIFIKEKDLTALTGENSSLALKLLSHLISRTIQHLNRSSKFLADIVQWGENASRRVITDDLTDVYNRSFLEDAVENFFHISKSNNKPLSLFMMDIDNFRVINEKFGQDKGNIILKEVVLIIKELISSHGILARYGGDEFSILLPETDLKKAKEMGEQIRKAVEDLDLTKHLPDKDIPVSISIGISSFPETATELEDFKAKADLSLYQAKESGRNKVACIE
ncbi:MAG: GGDEF domain-containing protein [Spirochaetes bacterium]|nr:GGDEF domain-containing protein [Spirochaetota bacterium]